jgi:hypothetical protein
MSSPIFIVATLMSGVDFFAFAMLYSFNWAANASQQGFCKNCVRENERIANQLPTTSAKWLGTRGVVRGIVLNYVAALFA